MCIGRLTGRSVSMTISYCITGLIFIVISQSAGISGKLFIFNSSLPIAEAPGKLKNREDRKLLATDKEKVNQHLVIFTHTKYILRNGSCLLQTILGPQSNFYEKLAKDCVDAGVSVDMFMFPNAYVDLATIGSAASMTGGQIFRYSYFKVRIVILCRLV